MDYMKSLPDECIDCVVTSPPYWGLRDYGKDLETNWGDWRGQLGLEPDYKLYIKHLQAVFAEVYRILKKTGTVFVNIGDTYSGSGKGIGSDHGKAVFNDDNINKTDWKTIGIKPKSLVQIPERFSIMMTDELGFIKRNTIIWYKRNCMPSSASDRFTVDFEPVYFYTKSGKYFFEQIFESWKPNENDIKRAEDGNFRYNGKHKEGYDKATSRNNHLNANATGQPIGNPTLGRNKRTVWDIPTSAFSEAHYAVFPEQLVQPMLESGCPKQICNKCGKARKKIYQDTGETKDYGGKRAISDVNGNSPTSVFTNGQIKEKKFTGYSDCNCNVGFAPGIACDPFAGAGTTLIQAKSMGLNFTGCEISEANIKIIERRLHKEFGMFNINSSDSRLEEG